MPQFRHRSLIAVALLFMCAPAFGQSPNTGTFVIRVADQMGGAIAGAAVSVVNGSTGFRRDVVTDQSGTTTVTALPVDAYRIAVSKPGFATNTSTLETIRAGETATITVTLSPTGGETTVTVRGTAEGLRADAQLGARFDSTRLQDTPVLGRKITSLPLLNAAFRPAKGTGDLFVNATFFVTGAGGRRQPAITVDGASNDEPWGRQTMFTTVPMGAVQELTVLSNAFSAEFGWTAGAAVNVVTKAGTNGVHGEAVFLSRPAATQRASLPASGWCAPSIATCAAPSSNGVTSTLAAPDIPDSLAQTSFAIGAPIVKDRTHLFAAFDYTRQDRVAAVTTPLAPAGTTITGRYRQGLFDARADHRLSASHALMLRVNVDRFSDTNPQDVVAGNVLPSAGRVFSRHTLSVQANETAVLSPALLNELRGAYLDGDPITDFEPIAASTQFTRAGTAPFTSGESRAVNVFSREAEVADTISWTRGAHYVRLGGNLAYSRSGGDGTEFGSAFTLGQFTVNPNTTRPLDELTLGDMTRYTQSFNFGTSTYVQNQWIGGMFAQDKLRVRTGLTLDLGLRYDVQSFSDSRSNLAPRAGFAWSPGDSAALVVRGGYGIYYTQLRSNLAANFELGGPLGIFTYTATPGQTGFPTSLTSTPVPFDPQSAKSSLPARNVTIRPGMRDYYTALLGPAFAAIADCAGDVPPDSGRPCYPSSLVNPRSQVTSIGVERRAGSALTASVDYVHQHWTGLDRTVDLNAPSSFVRTAPGQVRSASAADATRPVTPVNGGFRSINVIENLGRANYDGLETTLRYRTPTWLLAVSYTLSRAANTTEPDGNGIGPNDQNALGDDERGPSLLDQRHRLVIDGSVRLPHGVGAGVIAQLASARPLNATTGVDNNGDGVLSDRPVIDGRVVSKSSFRGSATSDVTLFAEARLIRGRSAVTIRLEVFNVFNHANILGRQSVYGEGQTPNANFGQALGGIANIEPPRMLQLLARWAF